MGVQGLWELLAPVGRRVSVETLAGKRLAIDASIWMIQFMKAMRDEKGEMVRNAHLIGFFRRICKLLYLRTKPVFVFDGGTPALKRRTVIARRRQRENAQAKIRKTAEKLLLNRLKDMRLKEQAKNLENQRRQQKSNDREKERLASESTQTKEGALAQRGDASSSGPQQRKQDEMSAASVDAEGGVDEVMEGLMKNDSKGKSILLDGDDLISKTKTNPGRDTSVLMKDYQEKLDEMLAASLAAEEDENLTSNASTSAAAIHYEEEGSDEDEQMLLPAMHGNIDPAVLASLPPSMQLDLLVQMRERLMAENRQKYQKVKKAPEKFSELQIQAYLKTVAFRREIDEVQRAAAGRGVGGVQTSRIAAEANREFIFSSSFSGDKEVLASVRAGGNGEKQQSKSKQSLPVSSTCSSSRNKSNDATEGDMDEPRNPDEDIEVYLDERGRFRIRNRHMGIRMTRDIQRNLDLMKEKERATSNSISNNDEMYSAWENFPTEDQFLESLPSEKGESANLNNQDEDSMPKSACPIEISFEDDGGGKGLDDDDDDNIFLQLAAGGPVTINSNEKNDKEESLPYSSDSDWEEMPIERKDSVRRVDSNPQVVNSTEKDAAEAEETICTDPRNSAVDDLVKQFSKGYLEEEADLQEAIKRSLLDFDDNTPSSLSSNFDAPKVSGAILLGENQKVGANLVFEKPTQHTLYSSETVDGVEEGSLDKITISKTIPLNEQLDAALANNVDGQRGIIKHSNTHPSSGPSNVGHDVDNEVLQVRSVISPENASNVASDSGEQSTIAKRLTEDSSHNFGGESVKLCDMSIADEKRTGSLAEASSRVSIKKVNGASELPSMMEDEINDTRHESHSQLTESSNTSSAVLRSHVEILSYGTDSKHESREEKNSSENTREKDSFKNLDEDVTPAEFSEAKLEEEMQILNEEYISLADEQRRLERNAESVSSEMFAECQELLQIFGLPYIIAPMEAEAQCAFMEQLNLVDGIVTDDSDVFLFGARSVYKNIFDDRKYVETYFMKDIEKELGLTREKLIRMALLLGSDYTEGVSGIGIVNAIEVVNAFPEEDGLQKFREWVESPDPTILGKTDSKAGSNTKKRGSVSVDDKGIMEGGSTDDTQEIKQIFMDKHRKVSKNWHIPSTFPSEAVISAYTDPQVDRSTDPFSWGKPDLLVLRKLCWEKFGWNIKKTDDLLLPVLKEYEKRETQLRMEAFYTFSERFAKIRSKRIKKAVKGIMGTLSSEVTDDTLQEGARSGKKKRVAPHENGDNTSDKDSTKAEKEEENQRNPLEKSARRKRQSSNQEMRNLTRSLEVNRRGRGRGRSQKRGTGRGQKDLAPQLKESSSDNDDTGNDLQEHHDMEPGSLQKVRRSSRTRNPVRYDVNEDDALDELQNNKEYPSEDLEEEFHIIEDGFGDTSTEHGGRKQKEKANTLIDDCASEDYLHMGGGFCADEAETGEPSMSHSEDPHLENKPTDDYLMVGGGFCVDEDETAEDQDAADALADSLRDDFPGGFDSMDKSDNDGRQKFSEEDAIDAELNLGHQTRKNKVKRPNEEPSLEDNVTVKVGTSSVGGLSAMPFLKKKKRRKS